VNEGFNAGTWCIAVTLSGNEFGLSEIDIQGR
jgi:hypothetical protein